MNIDRRTMIGVLGGVAGALRARSAAGSEPRGEAPPGAVGLLYDATRCVGCKACMSACRVAHGIQAEPGTLHYDPPRLGPDALTVIQAHEDGTHRSFMKHQCMHCLDPACVSGCMLGALHKDPETGAVEWDAPRCIGCRYCQIACPFQAPAFEWDSATPAIVKCDLCAERRSAGQEPACAAVCPREALTYGPRTELLREAHRRIAAEPARYRHDVYGEQEAGGTQVLVLAPADFEFAAFGLPTSDRSPAALAEGVQHTIYKGFVAPVVLYGLLGAAVWRHRHAGAVGDHGGESAPPAPLGGRALDRTTRWLAGLAAVAAAVLLWRFFAGLGAVTAMSDGYPMGLWIAFDVVIGTALGCGGYAIAILVYLLNRGRYHPLVRSALVTSALGYTLGGISVLFDVGRYWNTWRLGAVWLWNLNSILLEVAVCIMLYTLVLWVELAPAWLERLAGSGRPALARAARRSAHWVERALPFLIALGLLLPTMHQSSLGSLMLLAGEKLNGLWLTPLLPLLFLVSCICMGYGAVVLESTLSHRYLGLKQDTRLLLGLARPMAVLLLAWVAVRLLDVLLRGRLGLLGALDAPALVFVLELALFAAPAALLLSKRIRQDAGVLFLGAMLAVAAGSLFRFSTYLIAYDPGPAWSYFPAVTELLVSLGVIAFEVVAYLWIVRRLPILHSRQAAGQLT